MNIAEVIKFEPRHLALIEDESSELTKLITEKELDRMAALEFSWTLLIDRAPVICFGITPYWKERGELWAFVDKKAKSFALQIQRKCIPMIENQPFKRLEAVVDYDHLDGKRWCESLGMKIEAPFMEAYGRDGKDCTLYSRIRRDKN